MKKRTLLIKGAVALLFIVAIALMVRGERPAEPFKRIQPLFVALSVLLSFTMVAVSCLKWRVLLGISGHRLPFGSMMRFYFIGYFFSNLLPSAIGGDVMRSWYCGRRIGSQQDAAVSVFLERFTGLLLLLLLAVFGPLLKPGLYAKPAVFVAVAGAAALLGVISLFILLPRPVDTARAVAAPFTRRIGLLDKLSGTLFEKAEVFHGKLREALRVLRRSPGALLLVIGLTVLFYLLTWANVYVAYRAFEVVPEWRGIVSVTAVALLAGVLPIAPLGGLALIEFSYVYYFEQVGLAKVNTLAMRGRIDRGRTRNLFGRVHLWIDRGMTRKNAESLRRRVTRDLSEMLWAHLPNSPLTIYKLLQYLSRLWKN